MGRIVLQMMMTLDGYVAERVIEWGQSLSIGLVVGATYPEELAAVRKIAPDAPFLVPGVGAQGGDLEAAVRAAVDANRSGAVINSSRGVIYASGEKDFARAARRAALATRDAINRARYDS